jgi:hypothetical protein
VTGKAAHAIQNNGIEHSGISHGVLPDSSLAMNRLPGAPSAASLPHRRDPTVHRRCSRPPTQSHHRGPPVHHQVSQSFPANLILCATRHRRDTCMLPSKQQPETCDCAVHCRQVLQQRTCLIPHCPLLNALDQPPL